MFVIKEARALRGPCSRGVTCHVHSYHVTGLFPQLDHQKRVIAKSLWRQHCPSRSTSHARSPQSSFDRETQPSSKDRSKTSSSLHQHKKTSSSSSSSSSSKSQRSSPTERPAVSSNNKPEPVPSSEVSTGKQ